LGARAREAIYDYLERNCLLARNEIPSNLDAFVDVLDRTFGKGSLTIGRFVARKLFTKLDLEFTEIANFKLMDYLESARVMVRKEPLILSSHTPPRTSIP
jgi:hypothetical protein